MPREAVGVRARRWLDSACKPLFAFQKAYKAGRLTGTGARTINRLRRNCDATVLHIKRVHGTPEHREAVELALRMIAAHDKKVKRPAAKRSARAKALTRNLRKGGAGRPGGWRRAPDGTNLGNIAVDRAVRTARKFMAAATRALHHVASCHACCAAVVLCVCVRVWEDGL